MPAEPPSLELPITLSLPGGSSLTVRRVRLDDVDALVTLYAGLGDSDRRRRFFTQFRATQAWVVDWIRRCRESGDSLVAEVADTGEIVGEAAYLLQPNGNGDFALTVDAAWRGWLGPYLLDVLVELAAASGVPNLEADILTDNRSMQAIVRRRGAAIGPQSDHSVVHVVIGTHRRMAEWSAQPGHGPRVLVEVPGGRWGHSPELASGGYEVLGCPGPGRRHEPCPALSGQPCPLAATADAIVVALPPGGADDLVGAHRRLHPGVPVVVVGDYPDTVDDAPDAGVCRVATGTASAELLSTIERLTRSVGEPDGTREDFGHSTPAAGPASDGEDGPPKREEH